MIISYRFLKICTGRFSANVTKGIWHTYATSLFYVIIASRRLSCVKKDLSVMAVKLIQSFGPESYILFYFLFTGRMQKAVLYPALQNSQSGGFSILLF